MLMSPEENETQKINNQKLTVYVIADPDEIDIVKSATDQIHAAGFIAVFDWSRTIINVMSRKGIPFSSAREIIKEIMDCDIILFLPTKRMGFSIGAQVGVALSKQIPMIIVQEHSDIHSFLLNTPFVITAKSVRESIQLMKEVDKRCEEISVE